MHKENFEQKKKFFFDEIKDRINSNRIQENKKTDIDDDLMELVDNNEGNKVSNKEKFLRNFLSIFDFNFEDINLTINSEKNSLLYTLKVNKVLIGALKGINKHKEIHFIFVANNLKIFEFLGNDLDNDKKEFYQKKDILKLGKIFLNFKLEFGLGLKDSLNLNIFNSINTKSEIHTLIINLSQNVITNLFNLFVS